MVLEAQKISAYNVMLGRMQRKRAHADDSPKSKSRSRQATITVEPPLKRSRSTNFEPSKILPIPYSDAESGDEPILEEEPKLQSPITDLEQSLPQIKTDKQAIEDYEASRTTTENDEGQWIKGRKSIYVDAFNLALDTVLADESHLFDEAEQKVFEEWKGLGYQEQYLYVRLFLRKTAAWHRINKLRYQSDVSDMSAVTQELFRCRDLPSRSIEQINFPGEVAASKDNTLGETFTFADSSDQHISTLEEASSLLMLEELKTLAKDAKVQGKNKSELIKALRQTSGKQTSLAFPKREDSREESPTKQICDSNRDAHYVNKILSETTGPCIRLSAATFRLFERVHLVFYRSTEWTEKSLTTIILARIARRNFPSYVVSRSANIFSSRSRLLEFEAAIRTQFRVDSILEFNGTPNAQGLQQILDIFEEVYPRWEHLVREEQDKEANSIYASGEGAYLRRLSPAWVYTRIVHKGTCVLGVGKFKQHLREHSVLTALLAQRLFHTSRRGAWYQRKALLEEHYMWALIDTQGRSEEEQKKHWRRVALSTCEQGLQDNLVHLIYHYDLQKRITKLEKRLKIAKRLQHIFGHAALAKPLERVVEGVRVERRTRESSVASASAGGGGSGAATVAAANDRRGARTVWLDPREDDGECTVEAMCLSWYRSQGWKGYHSEGGILRTLFALLFYDLLFAYVPNVFQTAYQTCPLDLHTDAFYGTRMSEINARCAEISNGQADALLCETWEREAERQTCVVGLDWSYELADLREIVHCFGGEQLATTCRVMAQEYAQRGGGVPDLFLWSVESKEVCFSEVKSENDRLSDTQRLWMHVLMGAGVKVELCKAVAKEVRILD